MTNKTSTILLPLLIVGSTGFAPTIPQRYSQIVLPFPSERPYDFHYNAAENALILKIKNTTADELSALKTYDETLIRRLLLREMNATATIVRIYFRDTDVRVTVTDFQEPFRIVIDLFQKGFREQRDAKTGFPFARTNPSRPQGNQSLGYEPHTAYMPPQTHAKPSQGFAAPESPVLLDPSQDTGVPGQKRKLLQPIPQNSENPEALSLSLKKIPAGRGGAWKRFPPYIYRIQLASFKAGKSYKDFLNKNARRAVTSMMAMAEYAGKLFDFGHEGRALAAYRHVIHKSPLIFDKHPLHLWRLSEIHLGQGNLTLADGYYQAMTNKHPDHPLSRFAKMRRLDIRALRQLNKGNTTTYDFIAQHLDKIKPYKDIELRAQLNIRRVYWKQPQKIQEILVKNFYFIPKLDPENVFALQNTYNKIENPWTGFLTSTLILNKKLSLESPWTQETSDLADHYFKNYKGKKLEPYRTNLRQKMVNKFNKNVAGFVAKQDYLRAINLYESLSPALKKIKKTTEASWSLAEAYRLLGQPAQAVPFYKQAAKKLKEGPNRFRARFWLAVSINDSLDAQKGAGSDTATMTKLQQDLARTNTQLMQSWRELKPDEQQNILVSMKSPFEKLMMSQALLSTPVEILLQAWTNSLTSKPADNVSSIDKLKKAYAPTGAAVEILISLAEKFKRLGAPEKANKARFLLTKLDPKSFDKDKDTENLWANTLVALAETYRQSNQYLDAGRVYALTGSKSENYERRAEALYKGGLLLYRAGRREDALEALTKASQDGNNLLYQELAQKRLDSLNQ